MAAALPAVAAAASRSVPVSRLQRVWWWLSDAVSAYLPMLLMVLLALATWWLVKITPSPPAATAEAPASHEPDYTMQNFSLQRYGADGRLLAQIDGEQLRHYPDTDTMEIDHVRIRAFAPDGAVTLASARRALSNGNATEVQLLGGAQVTRPADDRGPGIEFRGEFLHAFVQAQRVSSHLPVVVTQGRDEIRAGGLEYDHGTRFALLKGPLRATLSPPPPPPPGRR